MNKYGVFESDMKLSNEEVSELKTCLKQKHDERM